MKIERMNDRQIRCILTKEDLRERELKISELAYGSEKARALFRDMIQQASYQFGFEAEDIPLMIEAIPLPGERIILIITKVEDPEELDTRFSKFAPSVRGDSDMDGVEGPASSGADDILDLFRKMKKSLNDSTEDADVPKEGEDTAAEVIEGKKNDPNNALERLRSFFRSPLADEEEDELEDIDTVDDSDLLEIPQLPMRRKVAGLRGSKDPGEKDLKITVPVDIVKVYYFTALENAIRLAHVLNGYYNGENSLYYDNLDNVFYLLVKKSDHTPEQFNKICNIITEYAQGVNNPPSAEAFFREHGDPIILKNALQRLSEV
ncbi:MAG: adaptor protein MecA [Lachnospiraceae bacterium]|nr:adaptor protein MecA [Lachnospiraceae bacterium]